MEYHLTPEMKVSRAWNAAATAAASDSVTTATKSAIQDGSKIVVTGLTAGFAGAASVATPKLVTVKKGTDAVRYYSVDVNGSLDIQFDEDDWIVGDNNEAVSAELAAGATSGATGFVTMNGFYVGKK